MTQNYWPVLDSPEIKTSELIEICRKFFPIYFYEEKNADKNFPAPVKTTLRWFRDNIKADEELKNKSANQRNKERIKCITLREKLWLELQYFLFTGKHLDIDNWALYAAMRATTCEAVQQLIISPLNLTSLTKNGWKKARIIIGSRKGK